MERKVGEIFTYNGKTYKVVKSHMCRDCAFRDNECSILKSRIGLCTASIRSDKTGVVFKEINNMENNQLTIDIPEGMEIDLENSDLAKGIVRFRSKWITIAEIAARECLYSSITVSASTRKKIIAISNLMDIARYFNGNWNYDFTKGEIGYMIVYDTTMTEPRYIVRKFDSVTRAYYGNPIFKNKADAQYVIDNPNFRDILDAIYKN